ncbi:MAG TPA: penicillin-binding protein 2 [Candidatus Hydrogenedentes bacterium]|nr:penicillin-binding protein 2 [Candidatus Hydrogenedentota bacterium]HIJ73079.1 penicillin-binding protein 2 [Candidatus Hydrogenedentota bacterium]
MTPGATKKAVHSDPNKRLRVVAVMLSIAFATLVVQLWRLQIVHGSEYFDKAKNNRLREVRLRAPRGIIYGRDEHVILADNRAACDLVLVPVDCAGVEKQVCMRLEDLVGINGDALEKRIEEYRRRPFTQLLVRQDLSMTELTSIEEFNYVLPGVFVVQRPQRRYVYGRTGGQILGWLNEIDGDELERKPKYALGDLIGRAGVELVYEPLLKGTNGYMIVSRYAAGEVQMRGGVPGPLDQALTDQFGRQVEVEETLAPEWGQSVSLTIDVALQAKAEALLEGERGAIAVLDADTGEALALASAPGYDPNVFLIAHRTEDRQRLRELLEDPDKRMRNRCYHEHYPPGSVFKLVVAVAALEEGLIDESTSFYCPGHFDLGDTTWGCWHAHGHIKTVDAIAYSCDVFFYNVGKQLGIEKINEWAARMGLGEFSGIDLPLEEKGLIPSPEWKERAFADLDRWNRAWQPGDTINVAIGQGATVITPLQAAVMAAAIVNGGKRVRPYVNQELGPQASDSYISQRTLELVQRGMRKCVDKQDPPSGTGRFAHIDGMAILGKTGTAQVVSQDLYEDLSEEKTPYEWRAHAWFVAGVQDRRPRIAVCVLVEHGLHGSTAAAPLAREIIAFFYAKRAPDYAVLAKVENAP